MYIEETKKRRRNTRNWGNKMNLGGIKEAGETRVPRGLRLSWKKQEKQEKYED
jgi:hypothetical protein